MTYGHAEALARLAGRCQVTVCSTPAQVRDDEDENVLWCAAHAVARIGG